MLAEETRRCRSGERHIVGGLVALCAVLASVFSVHRIASGQPSSRISVLIRQSVDLTGALPQVLQASVLPNGTFVVFSEPPNGDSESFGIFDSIGRLVKNLAGRGVPTGLTYLSSIRAGRGDIFWATALAPPELAQLNQNGVISATNLPQMRLAYDVALDEAHGYVYVSGCAPEHPERDFQCLLVHQFTIEGLKFQRSFLETDPAVLRNSQFGIQWVPVDVDIKGIVWAVDSPAFTLYSIDPTSGRSSSVLIASRMVRPAGKLDLSGGDSYTKKYVESLFSPDSVVTVSNAVVVAVRRPGELVAARYILEIFNFSGVQIGMDIPAPGRLVGKYGTSGLLFACKGKNGPTLIEGMLSGLRRTSGD